MFFYHWIKLRWNDNARKFLNQKYFRINQKDKIVHKNAFFLFLVFSMFEKEKKIYLQRNHEEIVLENWSSTKFCHPKRIIKPSNQQEVENLMNNLKSQEKIRIIGSGLSPNGIGFCEKGETVVSLEKMDEIISIDKISSQVKVQAGIQIGDLVSQLEEQGLTLQNLASINQQQLGGFTQIGAHGTGSSIPSVEEQIVSLTVVSPGLGTTKLSKTENPEWFQYVKCGLGCFGIVTSITLQCIPSHNLKQQTSVLTRKMVREHHKERLKKFRHVRYMWIPYVDGVVVICSNETNEPINVDADRCNKTQALVELFEKFSKDKNQNLNTLGFGDLRDLLIALNPLSKTHLTNVNKAELEFWRKNQGIIIAPSSEILSFDCGGQQLVFEVAFPCGSQNEGPNMRDITFVEELLEHIESNPEIAAPAPIEQRWSSSSTAALSPTFRANDDHNDLFSWVGIICYLPMKNSAMRLKIEEMFQRYCELLTKVDKHGKFECIVHWGKVQIPSTSEKLEELKLSISQRFDLEKFRKIREIFDPNHCLSNQLIEVLLT